MSHILFTHSLMRSFVYLFFVAFVTACGGGGGGGGTPTAGGGTPPTTNPPPTGSNALSCTFDSAADPQTIGCTDGTTTGLASGLSFATIDAQSGSFEWLRAATISFTDLTADVNTTGTGHGFTFDTTTSGSSINYTTILNWQTTLSSGESYRNIEVRGNGSTSGSGVTEMDAAALYVKPENGTTTPSTVNIGSTSGSGNLLFDVSSGTTYNDHLVGIYVEKTSTANTINNHGRIGFAANATGTKGVGHKGILVHRNISGGAGNLGRITINNRGVIDVTGTGTSSHGIVTTGGGYSGAITVNNYNDIKASGDIFHDTTASSPVTFNQLDATNTLKGSFTFGGGNDNLNVGSFTVTGATVQLTGTSNFGAGTDGITAYGTLAVGDGSAGNYASNVTLNGLENITLRNSSVLELYLDSNRTPWDVPSANLYLQITSASSAPIIRLHLPTGHSTLAQNSFTLLRVSDLRTGPTNIADLTATDQTNLAGRVQFFIGGTQYTTSTVSISWQANIGFGSGAVDVLNIQWNALSASNATPIVPVVVGRDVTSLNGNFAIKGSMPSGGGSFLARHGNYEFNHQFANSAPSDNNRALWQRALFGSMTNNMSNHASSNFAHQTGMGALSFYTTRDRNEANVMAHAYGIFTSFTLGRDGGNDFTGTGIFKMSDSIKARVGYHACHAMNDTLCLLTHASWETQRVKGAHGSFLRDIEAERYDFALGLTHAVSYVGGLSVKASVYGSYHSALKGNFSLGNGAIYHFDGKPEQRLATDIAISW